MELARGSLRPRLQRGAPVKHFAPPAVDLLAQAVAQVRPLLDEALPIGQRARSFWAGVNAARDLGAIDVIEEEFTELALETRLMRDLGYHGRADVAHLIRWALLDRNPFC
jgi:hypothetical protein